MILSQKIAKDYVCIRCDYSTCNKFDFEKHLSTNKHKNKENQSNQSQQSIKIANKSQETYFSCENCHKKYKDNSGLWRHKKKGCTIPCLEIEHSDKESEITSDKEDMKLLTSLIMEMMKSNQELQKGLMEVCKNGANHNSMINSNHTNSHNKTFNLQFFLNETCKDAMNIMDFVDSMKIEFTDLENIAQVGYVKGMSNLILKNLKALDVTMRPVHCSDSKREVVYVKDNNEWHNDSKNDQKDGEVPNQKLKKAIKRITSKNMKMIPEWKAKYPDCVFAESRKSTLYNNMYYHTVDSSEEHSDKIIKNIAREMVIEK
jgi:hypothetical protein